MRLIVALSLVTLAFAVPTSHGSDNSLVKRGVALAQDITNTVFNALSKRGNDNNANEAQNPGSEEEEDLNKRFFLLPHIAAKVHAFKHGRSGEEEQEQEPEEKSESPQPGQTQGRGVDGVALGADITNGVFDSLQRNGVDGDGYSDDSGVYETPSGEEKAPEAEPAGAPKEDKPPKKEPASTGGRSNEKSDGQSGAETGNNIANNNMQAVRDSGVAGDAGNAGIAIGQMYTNAALGS